MKLLHRYRDGESGIEAMLSDYAFLIHGLISLYESDFNPDWLVWALSLQDRQDELFWDSKRGGYFLTAAESPDLIVRGKEYDDGALPSGNSVALLNLLRLHGMTFDVKYRERASQLFPVFPISRHPAGFSQALAALDYFLDRSKEIAVIGDENSFEYGELKRFLYQTFLPNKVMAMGPPKTLGEDFPIALLSGRQSVKGKTTTYICEGGACLKPAAGLEEAKKLIREHSTLLLK